MELYRAPGFEIKCEGTALSTAAVSSVTEIMVETRLYMPAAFEVTLNDSALAFIGRDDGPLNEGMRLTIDLGYDKKLVKLTEGEISVVSAEMSVKGTFSHVAGFDMLHRLSRGTNYRRYGDDTDDSLADSRIAHTLINDAGLKPVVDETHSRNAPRTQDNRSDLDFLILLAKLNGYHLYAEDDSVFFTAKPPDRDEITLEWGKDLRGFYPRLCLNGLVKTVESRGRDASLDENYEEALERPREDLLFLSSAGRDMMERGSGRSSVLNRHDPLITGAKDAKAFLAGVMREDQAIVTASGSCEGNPKLTAGTALKIAGAGRFSGSYLVTRTVHRFSKISGYNTVFEARMTP